MALGQKLFEESGNVLGFKVIRVHPVEGTTMESVLLQRYMALTSFQAVEMLNLIL